MRLLSMDPRLTVGQWLDHWLENVAKQNVQPKTYVEYERITRTRLQPEFGDIELRRLGVAEIQAYAKRRADRLPSLRYERAVLRAALSEAERQGLILRNPAKLVRIPTPPRREQEPWTMEQARTFLGAVEGDRLEALYQLAMATGMRTGELLGLTWDDVDLDAGTLTIRRSLKHTKERGAYLDEPKTAASRRTLHLPESLREALRAHRDRQQFERITAAPSGASSDCHTHAP